MKKKLYPREKEVVSHVSEGLGYKEIALLLSISCRTVEVYSAKAEKKIHQTLNFKNKGIAEMTFYSLAEDMVELRFVDQMELALRRLTNEDLSMITHIAQGFYNRDMSDSLHISEERVEVRRRMVRKKLQNILEIEYVGIAEMAHLAAAYSILQFIFCMINIAESHRSRN